MPFEYILAIVIVCIIAVGSYLIWKKKTAPNVPYTTFPAPVRSTSPTDALLPKAVFTPNLSTTNQYFILTIGASGYVWSPASSFGTLTYPSDNASPGVVRLLILNGSTNISAPQLTDITGFNDMTTSTYYHNGVAWVPIDLVGSGARPPNNIVQMYYIPMNNSTTVNMLTINVPSLPQGMPMLVGAHAFPIPGYVATPSIGTVFAVPSTINPGWSSPGIVTSIPVTTNESFCPFE